MLLRSAVLRTARAARCAGRYRTVAQQCNVRYMTLTVASLRPPLARMNPLVKSLTVAVAAAAAATGGGVFYSTAYADESANITDEQSGIVHPTQMQVSFSGTAPRIASGETSQASDSRRVSCLGVGTRAVTFLGVYVYSAALYVDNTIRRALDKDAGTPLSSQVLEYMQRTVTSDTAPVACVRVSPYRNADLPHLRDGFARALELRIQGLAGQGVDEPEVEKHLDDVATLKQLFPKSKLNIGEELLLVFRGSDVSIFVKRAEDSEHQLLGSMKSAFVVTGLLASYLDDSSVIPALRDRVNASS